MAIRVECDPASHSPALSVAFLVPGTTELTWTPCGSIVSVVLPDHNCPAKLRLLARTRIHTQQLAQRHCDVLLADGVLPLSSEPNTITHVKMMHVSSVSAQKVCVLTCTQVEAAEDLCKDDDLHEQDSTTASNIVEETSLAYTSQKQDLAGMSSSNYTTGGKMFVSNFRKLPMWTMLASPAQRDVRQHIGFLLRLTEVSSYAMFTRSQISLPLSLSVPLLCLSLSLFVPLLCLSLSLSLSIMSVLSLTLACSRVKGCMRASWRRCFIQSR